MASEILVSLASNPYFRYPTHPTWTWHQLVLSAGFGLFGVGTLATAGTSTNQSVLIMIIFFPVCLDNDNFLSRKSIGGCWCCSPEEALGDHSWGYRLYDDNHDDNSGDGDVHGDDGDNDDGAGAVQRQGVQLVAGVDQSRGRQVVPPCLCQVHAGKIRNKHLGLVQFKNAKRYLEE